MKEGAGWGWRALPIRISCASWSTRGWHPGWRAKENTAGMDGLAVGRYGFLIQYENIIKLIKNDLLCSCNLAVDISVCMVYKNNIKGSSGIGSMYLWSSVQ